MNNIKEYLKSESNDIRLYHKNGKLSVCFQKNSDGDWSEHTYDSNGKELTSKHSYGFTSGFEIEEMTMQEVCAALGKTIKITK